ncbi:MAG: tetratricopeptide repeat protein [Deltaproteobacteria bacterium]|nr:tetratricopeptide repeat protein [Deltaproteobacteria bacterium]
MKIHRMRVVLGIMLIAGLALAGLSWADAAGDAYDEGSRLFHAGELRQAIAAFDKAIRLKPDYAEAYNGRGIAYDTLAQYERAIKDYDAAIRLNPRSAEFYYNRGNVYSDSGQQEHAVKDYDAAIGLNPAYAEAHFNRGLSYLSLGRSEAAADARDYLSLKGWREDNSQYMVLAGYFGDRRAQRDAEARKLLDEAVTKCDTSTWPYPIIRYLRHEITANALLAAATDNDKKTEAHAYLGLDLALSDQREAALTHLRWVKENGNKGLIEYTFTLAELRRLEGP